MPSYLVTAKAFYDNCIQPEGSVLTIDKPFDKLPSWAEPIVESGSDAKVASATAKEKAKEHFNKITAPQFLPKKQQAYVIYMQAVFNSQEVGIQKTESQLRKAMGMGLRADHDNAIARMHLAGICAQTNRRPEASQLLAEAKKFDKNGMLKEQITMLQGQMKMMPSKNQMRMAQMQGGGRKMVRR